jgi:hypothetical protein
MSSTLSPADRREIKLWIHDRIGDIRRAVERATELNDKVKMPTTETVVSRATMLAMGRFELDPDLQPEVRKIAEEAAAMSITPAALILTPMFRLSREDLLDVAHWAGRTDGYAASMVQAEAFVRAVVRGNLEELRKERVPHDTGKRYTIKRRKR